MKVEKFSYPGWATLRTYRCRTTDAWHEVSIWMRQNGVDYFLLSTTKTGYIFIVESQYEWFVLKWT